MNFKTISVKHSSHGVLSVLSILLLTLFASCSTNVSDDMNSLLGSVPENSGLVVAINLDKSIEQCGGKVSGGKIKELPKDTKILEADKKGSASRQLANLKEAMAYVKATAAVAFMQNNEIYVTAKLLDADKFCDAVAGLEEFDSKWVEEDGILYNKGIAVVDDRLWSCSSDYVLKQNIKRFMDLSEAESFVKNPYAKTLIEAENAIGFYGSIDRLMGDAMSFAQQAQAKLVMNLLFSSPKYFAGEMNFSGNGGMLSVSLLNSDYKPAKCEIDLSKIDPQVVASLSGNADVILAMSISQKLVNQIKDLGKSMGGSLPSDMLNFLSPLDGTIAYASPVAPWGAEGMQQNFRAVVTTSGKDNAPLMQLLEQTGKVEIDGRSFRISAGRYGQGTLDVAKVAERMKKAWVAGGFYVENEGTKTQVFLTLEPADGSLKLTGAIEVL